MRLLYSPGDRLTTDGSDENVWTVTAFHPHTGEYTLTSEMCPALVRTVPLSTVVEMSRALPRRYAVILQPEGSRDDDDELSHDDPR